MPIKKTKKLAILGASGHGKVVAEIAQLNGYDEITFFDDAWEENELIFRSDFPWAVIGNTEKLLAQFAAYQICCVAIGHNKVRMEKQNLLKRAGARFDLLVHPSAVVSRYAQLGEGSVVMANSVINPFTIVGESCIVNTGSTIDHDCILKSGVHISPGANIGGGVVVGSGSWVGIGASIKQYLKIGEECMVGAGAVVVADVEDHETVVGVPARPIRRAE